MPATVPPNLAAARQLVLNSDFFALCYLMLCTLAYTEENSAKKAVTQITTLLPAMPTPQGTTPGRWTCAWGPVASPDNSNLMYAAEFIDSPSNLPVFSAIVIRGTDTQAKGFGLFEQIIEDTDSKIQTPFPFNNPSATARVAQGTLLGLDILRNFMDAHGRTVVGYLSNFAALNPGAPIVVTGHSLGGCQTTVMAPFLKVQLPEGTQIVPNSFAAPTAGNKEFIALYEASFPRCPRWYNTFDLVPMAYADIASMTNLWLQCSVPCPRLVQVLAKGLEVFLANDHYTQQSRATSHPLPGICQPGGTKTNLLDIPEDVLQEIKKITIGGIEKLTLSDLKAIAFEDIHDWIQELLFQHLPLTGYWGAVQSSPGVAFIANPFVAKPAVAGS